MGFFTARSKQNPFAERKRREREQREAERGKAAIVADPEPVAVPFDRNPESEEYVQAPDIATFATGGVLPMTLEDTVIAEHGPEHVVPPGLISNDTRAAVQAFQRPAEISPETQAKIDAVVNHTVPPVADEPLTLDKLIETAESGPAPVAEPETPPESDAKRGRGRPRPQETIERDNAVHALLVGADPETGISKESIAAELEDVKEQQVYSSLRQLTKEGRAETRYVKPHGYRWFAV